MRILFIPTINPGPQGDLLEITILRGLREILGDDCVDYPRKKIMYHDFSESPKHLLHGRGFSLLTTPIADIPSHLRNLRSDSKFDAVIYGDGHIYGERVYIPEIDKLADGNTWVIDGHDLYGGAPVKIIHDGEEVIGNQYGRSFKRELLTGIDQDNKIYPTGFGIPESRILPIDLSQKDQLYQKTAPDHSVFRQISDLGGGFAHHKFTDEDEYYRDLSRSWFGLTCKKGGWDALRHYEIIAAGTLLLFRDYNEKPEHCAPAGIPTISYGSEQELNEIMSSFVVDNKPTEEYIRLLEGQRSWLLNHATTKARAQYIINVLQNEKNSNHRH
jgi:hypothetical protein